MKIFILALVLSGIGIGFAADVAFAGPCDNAWDTASDGSRCGGRAASERDGGR